MTEPNQTVDPEPSYFEAWWMGDNTMFHGYSALSSF